MVRRGELLRLPVIAQDQRIAKDIVRTAKALLLNSRVLQNEVDDVLAGEIRLKNSTALTVYPCTVRAPRGLAIPLAVLDEFAFWRVEGTDPDLEVLRAIRPAMLQFGDARRLIKLSTPWMKAGVLYDEFRNRNDLKEILIWQASTAAMTDRIPLEDLEKERESDPVYFLREYEAQFTDDITAFIQGSDIDAATMKNHTSFPPQEQLSGKYFAAIDASGLTGGDRFTLVIGHRQVLGPSTEKGDGVCLDLLKGWRRQSTKQVLDEIAVICKEYGINSLVADQFSFNFIAELLRERGIEAKKVPFSPRSKPEIFLALKMAFAHGKISILEHKESIRELRSLESVRLSGGGYRISAPRSHHDDYACAIALLAYKNSQPEVMPRLILAGRYDPGWE